MSFEVNATARKDASLTASSGTTARVRLARWSLIGALALMLAGCGTAPSGLAERRPDVPGPSAARDGESDYSGRPPIPLSAGARGVERDDGRGGELRRAEFYRGTGVLVRDTDNGRGDVGLSEDGRVTLNFANAEIRDVIDIVLGDTLSLNYIIDPGVQGTVTVRTSEPLKRSAVIPALENILALNGVAITLINNTYMVVPQEMAAKGLSGPAVSPSNRQLARGYGINIIPLNYASATAMRTLLEPFVSPGSLRADDARNLLIFSGTGNSARDLMEMVEIFDVDWMRGMSFALFPIQVAEVKNLVGELESVFLQDGKSPLAGLIRFVPIERLNAVLAISPQAAYLDRAQTWIERLDRGVEGAGRRIFVYYVENGRSADIAAILSQVFDGGGSGGTRVPQASLAPGLTPVELSGGARARQRTTTANGQSAEGAGSAPEPVSVAPGTRQGGVGLAIGSLVEESGDIRIIADEANNALLILATSAEFRMIESALKRLDVLPLQVLIEATIAEVTLNDELRYGLQWFFEEGDISASLSTLAEGAVNAVFPGFSFLSDTNEARVVLSALTEITDVNIISSPQLMVLDNQSARLQVGDEVPIATQSAVSVTDPDAPVVNSIQLRDTGVILEVTPRVNAGGLVILEVNQEVSSVVRTTTSNIDSPTISQRKIQSTIAVQSGDTVALGGLIRDDQNESVSGIPLLSDIPILGNLFKTTSNVKERTELLVLITPRVVRNRGDAQKVTDELRSRLRAIEPLEQKIRSGS